MLLANAAVSAVLQAIVLGGLPFLGYYLFQKRRHGRTFGEACRRAGLQAGDTRYLLYAAGCAALTVLGLLLAISSVDAFTREGSAQRQFVGLGLGPDAVGLAFFYGVIQTGFTEELLFRGLIAGSLSRRMPFLRANVAQALIFLLPHLLIHFAMPEAWPLLILVFAGALVMGWIRIRSGSILGSWLIHASANVTMGLLVAARTVS
ncbi:MAG: lysostaphin resistance A-like protein [Vicinamibacterales bacterium]